MSSGGRTSGNGQKIAEKDSSSASMASQDGNNFKASAKDLDLRSSARRNTNPRCSYFTLLTDDSNGTWRMVAVPFNSLNLGKRVGSGSQSFTDRNFSGSKGHYQSRNRALTYQVSKENTFPAKSSGHSNFNADSASELGKHKKKNNTKKTQKKGNRDQKLSLDAGSAESGSSNNIDLGTGPLLWETTSTVLSPDSCGCSSEDNCGGSINFSESSKSHNTDIGKIDTPKTDYGSSILNESLELDSMSVSSKPDDVRHKGSRKVPRNSSFSKKSSSRKFQGQSSEYNNVSWQEISGNVDDKGSSRGVDSLKIASFPKKNHNDSQTMPVSTGKMKRNTSAGSKQELNFQWRKSLHASKSTSNLDTKMDIKLDNEVEISSHSGGKREIARISRPATSESEDGKKTNFLKSSSQCIREVEESYKLENTARAIASSEAKVPIDTIVQAVNNAYKAQLASETVEKSIGCPLVELEKFLRAASPVIPLSKVISSCRTCLPGEMSVLPLCPHKIPNLPLEKMWQWYERNGNFGLEVKAEDCENSKRFGADSVAFRAYFVPFLSAVQLFRKKLPYSVAQLFSVLIPQDKRNRNITKKIDDPTSYEEFELVYEYFEAERPQHRRPLFGMIKDLVSGNEPSQGSAFGDPSKLFSMALDDLHPKSWFSVAWYPIYRIPDEKFQSTFLTYHSLGHLIHESASSNSFSSKGCVVSPVVGLQCYNTQGECWLQQRTFPKEVQNNYNHSEVLKERLKTLEHTASVMARAEVTKGNAKSFNRQPDYEFFLSRRRR